MLCTKRSAFCAMYLARSFCFSFHVFLTRVIYRLDDCGMPPVSLREKNCAMPIVLLSCNLRNHKSFPSQVLLNTWLHMYKKQRREQELVSILSLYKPVCILQVLTQRHPMQTGPEVIEEIIYGLESGILFG